MSQPYVGEIRMFGGNFAPVGWMFCSGQLLPISEFETLFNLIGTTYGGDGEESFALPNLQSRVPIHQGTSPLSGSNYIIGEAAGVEEVTLNTNQIPQHSHPFAVSSQTGTSSNPSGNVLDQMSGAILVYKEGQTPNVAMAAAITPDGGSQPHTNIQPFLVVNFIISLFGIFPTPT